MQQQKDGASGAASRLMVKWWNGGKENCKYAKISRKNQLFDKN